MSEAAAERPRPVPVRTVDDAAGGGNILTRSFGGLPGWGWVLILGVGGVAVWYIYKSRQSAASTASTTASSGCTDSSGASVPCDQADYGGEIATLQSEIIDLQQGQGAAADQVTVPDVVGVNVEQATAILKAAGLQASGPAGVKGAVHTVTSTTPKAGEQVPKGSSVALDYKTTSDTKPAPAKKPATFKPSSKRPVTTPAGSSRQPKK